MASEIPDYLFEKWAEATSEKVLVRANDRNYPYFIFGEFMLIKNLVRDKRGPAIIRLPYEIGKQMYLGESADGKNLKRSEIIGDVFGHETLEKIENDFQGNDLKRVRLTLCTFLAIHQDMEIPLDNPAFVNLNDRLEPGLLAATADLQHVWPKSIARVTAKSINDALVIINNS